MQTNYRNKSNPGRSGEGYRSNGHRREREVEPFDEFRGYQEPERGSDERYGRNERDRPFYNDRDRDYFSTNREGFYDPSGGRNNYNNERDYRHSYREEETPDYGRRNYSSHDHRNDDRNFFERAGDKIREAWNERTEREDWNENNPYFNDRYRDQDFAPDYRDRERYRHSEPMHSNTYKGRYYHRHETPQDKAEIRRRYEESRRNSNWSNAYLPTNNY